MKFDRLFIGFALVLVGAAPSAAPVWKTYVNVRFGYVICYPPSLRPGREADNGDGRAFAGPSGGNISVWGENNVLNSTLTEVARDQANKGVAQGRITYEAAKANWAVSSGEAGSKIFYRKVIQRADQFLVLNAEYPRASAGIYSPIITTMSRCFRAGTPGF